MTAAWWTKLRPLTRLALFLTVCLRAALGQEFLPQLLLFVGLLLLLFTCGAAASHYRLLIWAHVLGFREHSSSLSPSDTKPPMCGPTPCPGARWKVRDTHCAWSASSSPTSCSSASPARARSSPCSRTDGCQPPPGTLLSTAMRFVPLSLTGRPGGSTTSNAVAGCACARGHREVGCPSLSRCSYRKCAGRMTRR